MTQGPILEVSGLGVSFGGLMALGGVDLEIMPGELAGLIGPNGAGKTTCFNLLTGRLRPDEGSMAFAGRDLGGLRPSRINKLGIARTFQNIRLFEELSLLENVLVGFHGRLQSSFISAILRLPGYVRSEKQMHAKALELLELVGLGGLTAEPAGSLPYGQQRLLEIARALATGPRLLLLDEPAAGMNPQETAGLADLVKKLQGEMGMTVLLIEHDMRFVMNLCQTITVLDQGRVIARGEPEEVQMNEAVIEAYLGAGIEMAQAPGQRGRGDA